MRPAAVLAALLLLAGGAAASPLDPFLSAFGSDGVEVLAARGYLVLQGPVKGRRLAAVNWKALESLAAAAPSCLHISSPTAAGPQTGTLACRGLPMDGLMTPRLHRLAFEQEAERQESWTLAASSAPDSDPEGLSTLFETRWGRTWAQRGADKMEDPTPLAKAFFEEELSGPRPEPEAVKHFLSVCAAEGAASAAETLAADTEHGAASSGLRALVRRYLLDERLRHGLQTARQRVAVLRADKDLRREMAELDAVSAVLASRPALLSELETALSTSPAPSGGPELISAGLHLQRSTRLGQHELGDEAVVSGAYWVDGLAEGDSVEVEETSFIETTRGFSETRTRRVKRRNGGPYAFERTQRIAEPGPFALRVAVSAAGGASIDERVEVPVGPDYALAVGKQARAIALWQNCDPAAAEPLFADLEALIGEAARSKPQYKDLLERARKARARAAEDARTLSRLEETVASARPDAAPQACRYDLERTDAAIKLTRGLPPGCDRHLPELLAQRTLIARRAADQDWFMARSSRARSKRRSCDFEQAARLWSAALSVLEADPAARCGKVDREAAAAQEELVEAQQSLAWNEAIDRTLAKAESETSLPKKLSFALQARARLASLPDRGCRGKELGRAERIVAQAAAAIVGPDAAQALARLPHDKQLASVQDDVRKARAKLLGRSDAATQPEAAPPPAPSKPAPPKIKPKKAPAKTPAKPKKVQKKPSP